MKKKTFLDQLKKELSSLPKEEVKDILADYQEYFIEGKKDKRTEEDIAKGLGKPKQIAKNLKAEYHIKKAKEKASIKNILKAVLASISLGLFNIIILLGPLVGIIAVIISMYAITISLVISGIATLLASIPIMVVTSFDIGLGVFFASTALISGGILLGIGMNFITKYFLRGLIAYMKMNVKIVKGE